MVHWLTPGSQSGEHSWIPCQERAHMPHNTAKKKLPGDLQKLDRPLVWCSTNTRAPSSLKLGGLRRALTSCLAKFTTWKEPEEAAPYVQETHKKPHAQEDQVSCGYIVSRGLWGLTWTINVVILNLYPLRWQMRREQAQLLVNDQQWTAWGPLLPKCGHMPHPASRVPGLHPQSRVLKGDVSPTTLVYPPSLRLLAEL